MKKPKILSPAGNTNTFLAAIAAGTDAVYCGLKIFSARMEADNFSIEELSRLSTLAKTKQVEVYLALNSIIKESELEKVYKILLKVCRYVDIDALIIQDPALITLARKAGFKKKFHLSTLANCTFPSGLNTADRLGFHKVVLPREFTVDEIKTMADRVPENLELEAFVHGALCYSISGRCYWSSWLGGKSALRGRCVQPCRRVYEQKGLKKRHFSCLDFSADVLAKVLKDIPGVSTWKIEGRKKSPHYVYYTTKAYRLLRDEPKRKKEALSYLEYALGRSFSHYNLLTQRKINPLAHQSETGSGLFIGRTKNPGAPYFATREALFPEDLIRIGHEEDTHHDILKVTRAVPQKGKFFLPRKSKYGCSKGTPVYLIDRRDKALAAAMTTLNQALGQIGRIRIRPVNAALTQPSFKRPKRSRITEMVLSRGERPKSRGSSQTGIWISVRGYRAKWTAGSWLWLDPLLFPEEEKECARFIAKAVKKGAKKFVINAVWQLSLFEHPRRLNIWAGPFCNITNSATVHLLSERGISGAFAAPELDRETFLALPQKTGLPMGVVLQGNWPLGISRIISGELKPDKAFQSPMNETAWISRRSNNYFIFPNWRLDLRTKQEALIKAGYTLFVNMVETVPKGLKIKKRQGLWNWHLKLI